MATRLSVNLGTKYEARLKAVVDGLNTEARFYGLQDGYNPSSTVKLLIDQAYNKLQPLPDPKRERKAKQENVK